MGILFTGKLKIKIMTLLYADVSDSITVIQENLGWILNIIFWGGGLIALIIYSINHKKHDKK